MKIASELSKSSRVSEPPPPPSVRLSKNPIKNLVSKLMKAYVVPERREDNSGESMRTTFQDSGTIKNMLSGFKNTLLALKDAVWINTAAATEEAYRLSMCNPCEPHQRHLSSAAASQHQLHSTACSQNELTPCEGLRTQTSRVK